jgi:hypothetical protein
MSDESEVDKVLSRVGELRKYLGKRWTVVVVLFALWILRKKAGLWSVMARTTLLGAGISTYVYWNGFFG